MDVISFANLITIRDGVQLMNFDYHRKHRFMINFHFALVDNTKDSVAAACSNMGVISQDIGEGLRLQTLNAATRRM